jgi:hypothetical protein
MMKQTVLSILLTGFCFTTYGTIRYVTVAGDNAMDGTSWSNAYPAAMLQTAIAASNPGDEVWVAGGIYIPTIGTDRTAAFSMKNDVLIYGSFAGTETSLSQRILSNGLTSILSGELGLSGLFDNCYHTISNSGLNNTAVIDGFIVRDANDDRPATIINGLGGGIFNNGSGPGNFCSPTIRNCVITGNRASFGAGIFNSGYDGGTANPVILNCVITGNTAITGGGGIDNFGLLNGNASPLITNCVIYNNTAAQRAGAMYCWGGNNGNASPVVVNTVFVNNSAIDGGGIVSDRLNAGAGSSGNSNPSFKNCIFWGNTASGTGPQFFILGGATFTATYTDINLTGQIAPHIISGAGTGNINVNPLFTDIALGAGPDGNWMTADDGLQLSSMSSPCYNTGDNTGISGGDILFRNRIANGFVDMGAYELNAVPLGVRLTSFSASVYPYNIVKLYWTTANEQNNSRFDIQRSMDRLHFETVGSVSGALNSNSSVDYSYPDKVSWSGLYYYRLKQFDIDGQYDYSKIISVKAVIKNIEVSPNPTSGIIKISGIFPSEIKLVKLINSAGILLKAIKPNGLNIDISELSGGVYILKMETLQETISAVVVKR